MAFCLNAPKYIVDVCARSILVLLFVWSVFSCVQILGNLMLGSNIDMKYEACSYGVRSALVFNS